VSRHFRKYMGRPFVTPTPAGKPRPTGRRRAWRRRLARPVQMRRRLHKARWIVKTATGRMSSLSLYPRGSDLCRQSLRRTCHGQTARAPPICGGDGQNLALSHRPSNGFPDVRRNDDTTILLRSIRGPPWTVKPQADIAWLWPTAYERRTKITAACSKSIVPRCAFREPTNTGPPAPPTRWREIRAEPLTILIVGKARCVRARQPLPGRRKRRETKAMMNH